MTFIYTFLSLHVLTSVFAEQILLDRFKRTPDQSEFKVCELYNFTLGVYDDNRLNSIQDKYPLDAVKTCASPEPEKNTLAYLRSLCVEIQKITHEQCILNNTTPFRSGNLQNEKDPCPGYHNLLAAVNENVFHNFEDTDHPSVVLTLMRNPEDPFDPLFRCKSLCTSPGMGSVCRLAVQLYLNHEQFIKSDFQGAPQNENKDNSEDGINKNLVTIDNKDINVPTEIQPSANAVTTTQKNVPNSTNTNQNIPSKINSENSQPPVSPRKETDSSFLDKIQKPNFLYDLLQKPKENVDKKPIKQGSDNLPETKNSQPVSESHNVLDEGEAKNANGNLNPVPKKPDEAASTPKHIEDPVKPISSDKTKPGIPEEKQVHKNDAVVTNTDVKPDGDSPPKKIYDKPKIEVKDPVVKEQLKTDTPGKNAESDATGKSDKQTTEEVKKPTDSKQTKGNEGGALKDKDTQAPKANLDETTFNEENSGKPSPEYGGVDDDQEPLPDDASETADMKKPADVKAASNKAEDQTPIFPEQEDSHFFAYFLTIVIVIVLGYLIVHNKQKILGLIVEGRGGHRRRLPSYRKLDPEPSKGSHIIY